MTHRAATHLELPPEHHTAWVLFWQVPQDLHCLVGNAEQWRITHVQHAVGTSGAKGMQRTAELGVSSVAVLVPLTLEADGPHNSQYF